jgi:hypothetical protein
MPDICDYHYDNPTWDGCSEGQKCIHQRLPSVAAVVKPDGGVAMVKRGEVGYWPADGYDVDHFNERMGVTPAQRSAMLHGSMFGWDVELADPDNPWNIDQPMGGPTDD